MLNRPGSSLAFRKNILLSSLAATICIAIGTFAAWNILGKRTIGIDDANIFFVYARNFAHGHGIVYNVGGEHVEGFTSMLYFLLCSVGYFFSPAPETALFWMNFVFAVLTSLCLLYVLNLLADRLDLGPRGKLLLSASYLIWLLANPAYFAWSVVTLMDSGVYSMLITAGYAFIAILSLRDTPPTRSNAIQLGALCSMCILARPEGNAWAVVETISFACLCWIQTRSLRSTLRLAVIPLGTALITYAALTTFREVYFGYPLPNTFYAKVSSSPLGTLHAGIYGLKIFLRLYGASIILPLCLGILWIFYLLLFRKAKNRLFWFSVLTASFTIVGLALPIAEGGDHFAASRMYQNIYPLLGISVLLPPLASVKSQKLSFDAIYLLGFAILITITSHATWRSFSIANRPGTVDLPQQAIEQRLAMRVEFDLAETGRIAGTRMDRIFNGGLPNIGVTAAGGIAYTYHGTVHDLLGLNDSHMAHADKVKIGPKDHASFNARVFYEEAPDIILPWASSDGTVPNLEATRTSNLDSQNFDNQIFKDIFHQDRFRSTYILAVVRNPADPTEIAYGYFRSVYLQDLAERGFEIINSAAL